ASVMWRRHVTSADARPRRRRAQRPNRRRVGIDRAVHLPRVHLPRRLRPADELSSAALVAVDARVGIRRPRERTECLPGGGPGALPVLQLWGCDADHVMAAL